jgi:hypothetical protein
LEAELGKGWKQGWRQSWGRVGGRVGEGLEAGLEAELGKGWGGVFFSKEKRVSQKSKKGQKGSEGVRKGYSMSFCDLKNLFSIYYKLTSNDPF